MKHFQFWGTIIVETLAIHKKLKLPIQINAYLLQGIKPFTVKSTICKRTKLKWDTCSTYGTVIRQCYHIKINHNGFEDFCDLTDRYEDRSNQSPQAQMCLGILSGALDSEGDRVLGTLYFLLNSTAGLCRSEHLLLPLKCCCCNPFTTSSALCLIPTPATWII